MDSPQNDLFFLSQLAASQGGPMLRNRILEATKVTVSPQLVAAAQVRAAAIKNGSLTPRSYPSDGLDKKTKLPTSRQAQTTRRP